MPEAEQTIPTTLQDKFKYLWGLVRLGHEGVMLDKIVKQNAIVRQVATGAARGNFDNLDAKEIEEMGVSIGNETHNHIQKTAAGMIPLLATALGGTGLGAAAVMYWALQNAPTDKGEAAQPPAAATPNDDTNTQYEFGLGFPK